MELMHSPGPWAIKQYNGYDAYKSHVIYIPGLSQKPNNKNYVAKVNWFPHDRVPDDEITRGQANAQLIQHAPEMLQALIDVRKVMLETGMPEVFIEQFHAINKVLAKAVLNWGARLHERPNNSTTID